MSVLNFFKKAGSLIASVLGFASTSGLTDAVLKKAIDIVRRAEQDFATNSVRREWAVSQLVRLGLPESLARLAVELAVQAIKAQDARA